MGSNRKSAGVTPPLLKTVSLEHSASETVCAATFSVDKSTPMVQKKQHRLLTKMKSRPAHEVNASTPVGTADLGSQPRLKDFCCSGVLRADAMELHAIALREWMLVNIDCKGMEKATRVCSA
jgi:hypothetical protein